MICTAVNENLQAEDCLTGSSSANTSRAGDDVLQPRSCHLISALLQYLTPSLKMYLIWRSLSPLLWRFRANLVPCQRFLHKAPEWDLPCPAVITFDIRITKPNISRRDFLWPCNISPCANGHWSSSFFCSGHVYCRSELSNKNKPFWR